MNHFRSSASSPSTGSTAHDSAGGSDRLVVVIDEAAHRTLNDHCQRSLKHEVCGVLVGFIDMSQDRPLTRVAAVIEGLHAREEQMSVTFTHDTWDTVHGELAKRSDGAVVVGWYHTHPDFGIFYSDQDLFVHRYFFGSDGQVGIVIDPVRSQRGVFASWRGSVHCLSRYHVRNDVPSDHAVECQYVPEPIRELPEATAAANLDVRRLDSIEAALAQIQSRTRQIQFVQAGALIVLLAAGYLGYQQLASAQRQAARTFPPPVPATVPRPTAAPPQGTPTIDPGATTTPAPMTTPLPATMPATRRPGDARRNSDRDATPPNSDRPPVHRVPGAGASPPPEGVR